MSTAAHTTGALRAGVQFGQHRILRWTGTSDLGDTYEAAFGTTVHQHRLIVLWPEHVPDAETLNAVLTPLAAVHHPCLSRYFAWGVHDGLAWIRAELSPGTPLGGFTLPPEDRNAPWPRGEMVTHAERLRALCRGTVPQPLLSDLAADVLEGLGALHRAGLAAGPLSAEAIVFHKDRHGPGIVAKVADFGLLALSHPDASSWAPRADLASAAALFRQLLCGSGDRWPTDAWPGWETFLCRLAGEAVSTPNGGTEEPFADADAAWQAFDALRRQWNRQRPPRQIEPPVEAPAATSAAPPAPRRAHERRKRVGSQRDSRTGGGDDGARTPVSPAVHVLVIFLVIVAIGYGAYWIFSRSDRLRREGYVGPAARGATPEEPVVAVAEGAYWAADRNALRELAAQGHYRAAMRLAFLTAIGDAQHPADEEAGAQLAAAAAPRLRERIDAQQADGDSLFWLGYATLTGLGVPADGVAGRGLLEQAIGTHNHYRAMALLADYLAFGQGATDTASDQAALDLWQRSVDLQQAAADTVEKAVAFVLAGRGLPDSDKAAVVRWLERMAALRHPSAILALGQLSLEGRLQPLDEPQAMDWFRVAALTGNVESMRRMGWMFERGIGTPQSDHSAAIWYRRAAIGGDADAMEALAGIMAEARGGLHPNAEEQAEWRARAVVARQAARERAARRSTWWRPAAGAPVVAPPVDQPPLEGTPAPPPRATPAPDLPAPAPDPPAEVSIVPPVDPALIDPGQEPLVPMD